MLLSDLQFYQKAPDCVCSLSLCTASSEVVPPNTNPPPRGTVVIDWSLLLLFLEHFWLLGSPRDTQF